jgi:uncharacterized protein (DUF302 family)
MPSQPIQWVTTGSRCLAILACLLLSLRPATAEPFGVHSRVGKFEDVRFELGNAIIARGLTVHSEGDFAKMLARTGAEVGSTKVIYKAAEFVAVCSAKYGRMLVEADPAMMGDCPFMFYVYERADQLGVITTGFRRLSPGATVNARRVVESVEAMLDGIAVDAIK